MSSTDEPTDRVYAETAMGAWVGRKAEDVPPGWMDNMVRRLLEQVNRQLIKFEDPKVNDEKNDPETRDLSSQTLHRLELTINRLIRTETQRAAMRNSKASSNAGALEELKRKFDALAAARGENPADGEDE